MYPSAAQGNSTESAVKTVLSEPTAAENAFNHHVRVDPAKARQANHELHRELIERKVLFGGGELPTSIKPLFVPTKTQGVWVSALERFLTTAERVVHQHLGDDRFYRYLGLSPAARQLVEIDPGYERLAVVCRPDAVYNGSRIAILEVNADSPAMMTHADHVEEVQRKLFPMSELTGGLRVHAAMPRTPALLRALLETYREWGGNRSYPTIAIVDWADEATLEEQRLTAMAFMELGFPTFVCDPRQLSIQNGRLCALGRTIDIVQRRVLFPDFLRRADELKPLVTAYRDRLACMMNPLRSFLLGHKAVLSWLRHERCDALTVDDQQLIATVVPPTRMLEVTARDVIVDEQNRWVIKPTTGHGGGGVIIGAASQAAEWRRALMAADGQWIVQEFRKPVGYELPCFDEGPDATFTSYYLNWNPFFFGGRFGGAIARTSKNPVVNIRAGGALLPVIAC